MNLENLKKALKEKSEKNKSGKKRNEAFDHTVRELHKAMKDDNLDEFADKLKEVIEIVKYEE